MLEHKIVEESALRAWRAEAVDEAARGCEQSVRALRECAPLFAWLDAPVWSRCETPDFLNKTKFRNVPVSNKPASPLRHPRELFPLEPAQTLVEQQHFAKASLRKAPIKGSKASPYTPICRICTNTRFWS